MKHRLAVVAAAVLAVSAAGIVAYDHWPSSQGSVALKSHPDATLLPAAINAYTPKAGGTPTAQPPVAAPVATPKAGETRTAMIDRLANGTPADKLDAFRVLQQCHLARLREVNMPALDERKQSGFASAADSCAGVLGGQESERLPLLVKAAEGGAPGAMQAAILARDGMSAEDFDALFGRAAEINAAAGDKWGAMWLAMKHNAAAIEAQHPEQTTTVAQVLANRGTK